MVCVQHEEFLEHLGILVTIEVILKLNEIVKRQRVAKSETFGQVSVD